MEEHSRAVDGVREAIVHLEYRHGRGSETVDRRFEAAARRCESIERRLEAMDQKLDHTTHALDAKMSMLQTGTGHSCCAG